MRVAGKRTVGGFTILELLIVLAIMMVVAAMATPNILAAIATYRLKSAASDLAGLLQRQRISAVRLNYPIVAIADSSSNRFRIFLDLPNGNTAPNGTYDAGEPMVLFPKSVSGVTTGFPGDATTGLGYTRQALGTAPRFNGRGLPCVMVGSGASSTCGGLAVGFVIYLKSDNVFGGATWAAVTITPAGRIRTWMYQGTKYQ